jgi:hypothetical protein
MSYEMKLGSISSFIPHNPSFFLPDPDKQDKCVNEIIFCTPQKRDKYVHEIISAISRRTNFYRTKNAENDF